jgi:hypothetical protein
MLPVHLVLSHYYWQVRSHKNENTEGQKLGSSPRTLAPSSTVLGAEHAKPLRDAILQGVTTLCLIARYFELVA